MRIQGDDTYETHNKCQLLCIHLNTIIENPITVRKGLVESLRKTWIMTGFKLQILKL